MAKLPEDAVKRPLALKPGFHAYLRNRPVRMHQQRTGIVQPRLIQILIEIPVSEFDMYQNE